MRYPWEPGTMVIAALSVVLPLLLQQPVERHVTVNVQVTGPAGAVASLPLSVRGGATASYGTTDADGRAVLEAKVQSTQPSLVVSPRVGPPVPGETDAQYDARCAAQLAVMKELNFQPGYIVPLSAKQDQYTLGISAEAARRVIMRINRNGEPLKLAIVAASRGVMMATSNRLGSASLSGVRQSREQLFVRYGRDVLKVVVPAGTGQFDLGGIDFPASSNEASIQIVQRNLEALDHTYRPRHSGVTLVSAGGVRIISLRTIPIEEGAAQSTSQPGKPPQGVPSGVYYVAPGEFFDSPAQLRLIDRVSGGQSVASIPRIDAVAGQLVSLDFDAAAAEAAILAP